MLQPPALPVFRLTAARTAITLRALALGLCACASTTLALPAQWTEVGDAGQFPAGAQVPDGFSIGPLSSIAGTLPVGDVDMYLIDIPDPAAFSATTVGGTTVDTQLWLFHLSGLGVTFHDGSGFAGTQSTITGTNVPFAGSYYLAISASNVHARAAGQLIWNHSPPNSERRPDGLRRHEPLDQWAGSAFSNGPYTISLTGASLFSAEIVCPDNHYLTDSPHQTGSAGAENMWRNDSGRFQLLYEGSHFLSAGASGAIHLDKMMFRGEDGSPNLGGQSWANVTVTFGSTQLAATGLTTNFAANLATATNTQTATFPIVTVAPSIGSTPNNNNIALDLITAINGYFFNPSTSNLLIDITLPSAPTGPVSSGDVMPMQIASAGAATVRAAGVTSSNPGAATGQLKNPLVVSFKIDGQGGWSPPVPARNEYYGAACGGSPSSFYQGFLNGQPLDLVGLTLTPDTYPGPNLYTVASGAPAFDATQVNAQPDSTSDDSSVDHALGFSFEYPGGSTTTIRATTNGFVYLAAAGLPSFVPTVGRLLGTTQDSAPCLAPCWYDFHAGRNVGTHPNSGMHVLTAGTAPNRVAYVTWYHVGVHDTVQGFSLASSVGGHAVHDMQMAIFEATGVVQFRYGAMPIYAANDGLNNASHAALVGFSRGRIGGVTPSMDPQSRDLSVEVPFTTSIEGTTSNMGQRVIATPDPGGFAYGGRAIAGQTLTFDAVNVPAGSTIGVQLLDFGRSRPGLFIPGIHAPGCIESTTINPILWEFSIFPASTVTGAVPLLIPPGVEGAEIYAQYAILDGLVGAADLVTALSNAVRIRVGVD